MNNAARKAQNTQLVLSPIVKQPLQPISQKDPAFQTPGSAKVPAGTASYAPLTPRPLNNTSTNGSTVINLTLRPDAEQDQVLLSLREQIHAAEQSVKRAQRQNEQLLQQAGQSLLSQVMAQPLIQDQAAEIAGNERLIAQYRAQVSQAVAGCRDIVRQIKEYGPPDSSDIGWAIEEQRRRLDEAMRELDVCRAEVHRLTHQCAQQDSYVSAARAQLSVPPQVALEEQLAADAHTLTALCEEETALTAQIGLQTKLVISKQDEINAILESSEYKRYLELQENYNQQLQEQAAIQQLSDDNDRLQYHLNFELCEQINGLEQQNSQLMERMIRYGHQEGFVIDFEDLSFDNYLTQLAEFIRQKYKRVADNSATVQTDDELFNVAYLDSEEVEECDDGGIYEITHDMDGNVGVRLLENPGGLGGNVLIGVFRKINELDDSGQLALDSLGHYNRPLVLLDGTEQRQNQEDSEIDQHSEHDTIDEQCENYYSSGAYGAMDWWHLQ